MTGPCEHDDVDFPDAIVMTHSYAGEADYLCTICDAEWSIDWQPVTGRVTTTRVAELRSAA
ncbi:hypothetical protein ACWEQ4_00995 [Rhodococcus sp. NPDC003994]